MIQTFSVDTRRSGHEKYATSSNLDPEATKSNSAAREITRKWHVGSELMPCSPPTSKAAGLQLDPEKSEGKCRMETESPSSTRTKSSLSISTLLRLSFGGRMLTRIAVGSQPGFRKSSASCCSLCASLISHQGNLPVNYSQKQNTLLKRLPFGGEGTD